MARKDYDSNDESSHSRHRHDSNSNTYDGDGSQDRMSQQRYGRSPEYNDRESRYDTNSNINYGERYGFSGYGRAHYDPERNRGWRESEEMNTWREGQPFTNREQDYRGGRWHEPTRSYEPKFGQPTYSRGGGKEGMDYGTGSERNFGTHDGQRERSQESSIYDRRDSGNSSSQSADGMRPSYRGIGPKNYRRSDERIHEEVCERLTEHPEVNAAHIEVTVSNGEITLSGTTGDRHMKRLAEDIADSVQGVVDVSNQIRVAERAASHTVSNERRGSNFESNASGHFGENGDSNGKSRKTKTV